MLVSIQTRLTIIVSSFVSEWHSNTPIHLKPQLSTSLVVFRLHCSFTALAVIMFVVISLFICIHQNSQINVLINYKFFSFLTENQIKYIIM